MPISQEQFEKLHTIEISDVLDETSRFFFKLICSCGYQGLLYTREQAEQLKEIHLSRRRVVPY